MTEKNSPTFNLTVTQVAAAALAAVTAALLGSRLGVAGTVVGAAIASMTTTTASAVYQHSLERSRARVRALRHRPPLPAPDDVITPAEPPSGTAAPTPGTAELVPGAVAPTSRTAELVPGTAARGAAPPATAVPGPTERGPATVTHDEPAAASDAGSLGGRRRFMAAVGGLAGFALALAVVTGLEAVRGESLSGDGGTTVGRVLGGGAGANRPAGPETPTAPTTTTGGVPSSSTPTSAGTPVPGPSDPVEPSGEPTPTSSEGTTATTPSSITPSDTTPVPTQENPSIGPG